MSLPKPLVQAVLFDLDGTLLDTLEDLAESCNAVLDEMRQPRHPTAAYRQFVGDGVEMLARRALPESQRSEDTIKAFVARMRTIYAQRLTLATRPYVGIPELLDELTARHLPMAILSNKPDDATRELVKALLGRWHFAAVQGARPDIPRKPAPDAAWGIARTLQIPPSSFLYLGDSGTDMRTAVAAGMYPVGALWGFRDAEELREAGAAALIAHPRELLSLIP